MRVPKPYCTGNEGRFLGVPYTYTYSTYTNTNANADAYAYLLTCPPTYVRACMHSCMHSFIHSVIHTHTHIHTYIHTHTYIQTVLYVNIHIHICVCVYIHTHDALYDVEHAQVPHVVTARLNTSTPHLSISDVIIAPNGWRGRVPFESAEAACLQILRASSWRNSTRILTE